MPAGPEPPDVCAQCGVPIPRGARACPACGADERTGWREASAYDALDLPDEAGGVGAAPRPARRRHPLPWYWLALGVLILLAFALQALRLWTFGWIGR